MKIKFNEKFYPPEDNLGSKPIIFIEGIIVNNNFIKKNNYLEIKKNKLNNYLKNKKTDDLLSKYLLIDIKINLISIAGKSIDINKNINIKDHFNIEKFLDNIIDDKIDDLNKDDYFFPYGNDILRILTTDRLLSDLKSLQGDFGEPLMVNDKVLISFFPNTPITKSFEITEMVERIKVDKKDVTMKAYTQLYHSNG